MSSPIMHCELQSLRPDGTRWGVVQRFKGELANVKPEAEKALTGWNNAAADRHGPFHHWKFRLTFKRAA